MLLRNFQLRGKHVARRTTVGARRTNCQWCVFWHSLLLYRRELGENDRAAFEVRGAESDPGLSRRGRLSFSRICSGRTIRTRCSRSPAASSQLKAMKPPQSILRWSRFRYFPECCRAFQVVRGAFSSVAAAGERSARAAGLG